jgi:hypothetical protein
MMSNSLIEDEMNPNTMAHTYILIIKPFFREGGRNTLELGKDSLVARPSLKGVWVSGILKPPIEAGKWRGVFSAVFCGQLPPGPTLALLDLLLIRHATYTTICNVLEHQLSYSQQLICLLAS